jgi:hypothetical protein
VRAHPTLLRNRYPLAVGIVVLLVALWALSSFPTGVRPGNPIHFMRDDLTDAGVIGLTVSKGTSTTHAESVRRAWLSHTPTWFDALVTRHELGEGQREARRNGVHAARQLAPDLDQPHLVFPGGLRGTSSGLAWALATLSSAYPSLSEGGPVGVTGSVDDVGTVQPVGNMKEKMATQSLDDVSLILVPHHQSLEARQDRRANEVAGADPFAPVIGVRSVEEALGVLCMLNSGDALPAPCSRFLVELTGGAAHRVVLGELNLGLCNRLAERNFGSTLPIRCEQHRIGWRWVVTLTRQG